MLESVGPLWAQELIGEHYPQTVVVDIQGETLRERIASCSPNAARLLGGLYDAFEEAIVVPNHMLKQEYRDTRNNSARGRSLRKLSAMMNGEFFDDTDFGDEIADPNSEIGKFCHKQLINNADAYADQECTMSNEIALEFIENEERLERAQRNFCKKLIELGVLEAEEF